MTTLLAAAIGLLVRPALLQRRGMQVVFEVANPYTDNPAGSSKYHVESRWEKLYWEIATRILGEDAVLVRLEADFHNAPLSEPQLRRLTDMPVTPFYFLNVDNSHADDRFVEALTTWPRLEDLSLSNTEVTDKVFDHLAAMPCLLELNLSVTNTTKQRVDEFRNNHRHVNVVWSPRISDQNADAIRACARNERIHTNLQGNVSIFPAADENGDIDLSPLLDIESKVGLRFNPKSRNLDMGDRSVLKQLHCVKGVTFSDHQCGDLSWLCEFPNLEYLSFSGCKLNGQIPPLTHLRELNVWGDKHPPTDADLMSLPIGCKLEELFVERNVELSDRAFEHIGTFKNLRHLVVVDATNITNACLEPLSKLPALTDLAIWSENISSLTPLARTQTLGTLDVRYCQIDDNDLDAILSLPNLRQIDIVNTLVTEEGVKKLIRSIPSLRYLHTNDGQITSDEPEFRTIRNSTANSD